MAAAVPSTALVARAEASGWLSTTLKALVRLLLMVAAVIVLPKAAAVVVEELL
jgi:hypothetical protein